jgi:hypothetical protein
MIPPPTFDEAAERGLLTEQGIGTFSNGSEWDGWSSGNCDECRWFDPDVAGKYCAFESAAFLGMVTPELATMFGWILNEQYGEFDAPEQCAFFRDKDSDDDDRPSVAPIDPAQFTFLAPNEWPVVKPTPAPCLT